jgi:battenin
LALTSFYDSRRALTAWSSGTGFAGIMGYGWVVLFTAGLGVSFQVTMLCALVLPVLTYANYLLILSPPSKDTGYARVDSGDEAEITFDDDVKDTKRFGGEPLLANANESSSGQMTAAERWSVTKGLWPFIIPLFLVYFSEYAMQSGVWAAMGFPIDSENARKDFYRYANWTYQCGVLVSRSSGMLWKADMKALWIMPIMQAFLLVFFIADAYGMWWYDWSILTLCFVVGLFGGAVYVGGFSLIADTVPSHQKEFSLGTAAVGADIGIACSNVAAIFIQKALYDYHDVSD